MQSKATRVDHYLKGVPAERVSALNKLRELCLKQLKGYEEVTVYGGAGYKKNNIAEVGFVSQKNFIGLYILKQDVMEKYRAQFEGKGISIGKGVIRFANANKINFELVNKILKETFISTATVC